MRAAFYTKTSPSLIKTYCTDTFQFIIKVMNSYEIYKCNKLLRNEWRWCLCVNKLNVSWRRSNFLPRKSWQLGRSSIWILPVMDLPAKSMFFCNLVCMPHNWQYNNLIAFIFFRPLTNWQGPETKEDVFTEILCTRTNAQIQGIVSTYKHGSHSHVSN